MYVSWSVALLVIVPLFGTRANALDSERAFTPEQVLSLSKSDLKTFLSKPTFKSAGDDRHPWNDFEGTDPRHHNANRFSYLITGIRRVSDQVIADKDFISASLITEACTNSFARFGYILDAKPENIIATWVTDGQTSRQDPWQYRLSQGVYSAIELINRTGWFFQMTGKLLRAEIYNEVLLDSGQQRQRAMNRVRVIGLYIIEDSKFAPVISTPGLDPIAMGWEGPKLSAADVEKIQILAKTSGLPLVKLVRKGRVPLIDRS